MRESQASGKLNLSAFQLSCWVLGLIAFMELMAIGAALATQRHIREVKTEIQTQYVMIPSSTTDPVQVDPVVTPDKEIEVQPDHSVELKLDGDSPSSVQSDQEAVARANREKVLNSAPPILDPVVEALVRDARAARVKGDLVLSLAKLQEAQKEDPENANVIYGLAKTYEDFGIFDNATVHYMKVYQMGPMEAGSLFQKAGLKLSVGLRPDVTDLAMIGWSRMSAPTREARGERRTLLLPVTVAPGKDFDPKLLQPQVRFYEEIDGKVSQAVIKEGDSGSQWVTGAADWQDGEEMAEVWYFVPDQDRASGFLFGKRNFYGFVAELYYDGRLVDIRAFPRTLLEEGRNQGARQGEFDELDGLDLSDFGAGDTLLPNLEPSSDEMPLTPFGPSDSPNLDSDQDRPLGSE